MPGLPTWDRPASACLSSRIPYGTPVTIENVKTVETGEEEIKALGFRQFRVRFHGDVVRIEIAPRRIGEGAHAGDGAPLHRDLQEARIPVCDAGPGRLPAGIVERSAQSAKVAITRFPARCCMIFDMLRNLFITFSLAAGIAAAQGSGKVTKVAPELDQIVPAGATIEKLAGGFAFTEGPVWMREGYLLFSDIPNNAIQKWTPDSKTAVFRKPSGYDGSDAPAGAYIGSNGLTLDRQGRLIICEHGNGRVTRLEKDGKLTVLADKYEGKRLNSPNDAVYKSDGGLYFTDPPYGFVKQDDDPKKELKFNGVYRLAGGKLQLLHQDMTRPNGIAFSPDEKHLYVANSDEKRKIWMRFDVKPDGSIGNGKVFHDATSQTVEGLPDGLKVDRKGNIYCTGPGGIWIFSPDGKHLGTIQPTEVPANCAWGDKDGKTLYMTARTGLYRIKLNIAGIRP